MKCDNCKKMNYHSADIYDPHSYVYCSAGHWEGPCAPSEYGPESSVNPWADCKDHTPEYVEFLTRDDIRHMWE